MNHVAIYGEMQEKMERWLHDAGDYYTFEDIMDFISEGKFQSFAVGDTWIVTQVDEYPRRKVVHITLVVGNYEEAEQALPEIYEFARSIGATRVTGFGREGWFRHPAPGWNRLGIMYAKDL